MSRRSTSLCWVLGCESVCKREDDEANDKRLTAADTWTLDEHSLSPPVSPVSLYLSTPNNCNGT